VAPNRINNSFIAALVPGLLSGLLIIVMSTSFATLIFAGPLSGHLDVGINLAVSCAVIVGLATTLFSRCQPVVAMADDDTAPLFALLASFVVAALPVSANPQLILTTAIAAIVFSTLLCGAGLALMGAFRMGGFIQFLPHSVMGGYLSAVGWLLLSGGFSIALAGEKISFLTLDFYAPSSLLRWSLAVAIALWLLLMQKRIGRKFLMPATVAGSVVIWYSFAALLGMTPAESMSNNFLAGPFQLSETALLQPFAGIDFQYLHWPAIVSNVDSTASIFLISMLSMMLTVNGLGHLNHQDPDMNRELIVAGFANISSGALGGMTGLPSYSLSSLAVDSGTGSYRNNHARPLSFLPRVRRCPLLAVRR